MPKVSVIVPVYNVEHYLAKCLDSLVNQTLKDIEILVINDGSQDDSQSIINKFTKENPKKIQSFYKENGGLSEARNFGIDRASGEFFAFVDSDDYIKENMLEEMYLIAQENNAEMVVCNLQKVDETGNIIRKLPQIPNMPQKIDLKEHFSVFSDLSYFACNKIFRKELFENKRFTRGIHFEDIELIPQLLLQCKTIAHTQNYHYQYLERQDSISKTHTEKGLDILHAVQSVERCFYESSFKNEKTVLKGFQILEGVYTFLAYLAYVRDEPVFNQMSLKLKTFMKEREISLNDILSYKRFGKNYFLSLPFKKQVFYLLYFLGQEKLIRKLI